MAALNVIIPFATFLTVTMMIYALFAPRESQERRRLKSYGLIGDNIASELAAPFSERVMIPLFVALGRFFARLTPMRIRADVEPKLVQAGQPIAASTYLGIRGACLVLPLVGFGFLYLTRPPQGLVGNMAAIVFVWAIIQAPQIWLNRKVEARQKAIQRAVPDALDLITVSMEAGLAFDAAIAKVVEKTRGPLRDEFAHVLQDMALGKLRREAFRELGERTGVQDLSSFVAAIIQADRMGISLAQVLRTQADEMRVRRRQRAEETAMKAPVKMLFPLIICIFPAMVVVTLGPAIMSIYTNVIVRFQDLR